MGTYIMLSRLTDEGRRTLKERPERLQEVNGEIEQMGARVVRQFALLGEYDFINVVEAPDNQTITSLSVDLSSRGTIRLKTLGPGTVVGEVSLYLETQASASVVTDEECQTRFLSKENFIKMNLEAPEKASRLHTYIVKLLSERLTSSNATISALMR